MTSVVEVGVGGVEDDLFPNSLYIILFIPGLFPYHSLYYAPNGLESRAMNRKPHEQQSIPSWAP